MITLNYFINFSSSVFTSISPDLFYTSPLYTSLTCIIYSINTSCIYLDDACRLATVGDTLT